MVISLLAAHFGKAGTDQDRSNLRDQRRRGFDTQAASARSASPGVLVVAAA
jgi:hypothetical protein